MPAGRQPTPVPEARQQHHYSFQHTQLGVYLVGAFALLYIFNDSAQGIIHKYDINKRFFYLWGILCGFAYLYMRPFIRRGLGSAQRGFINLGALYILWLCSAVFYHLPSFEALGIDIKADVSLTLSVACYSLAALGGLHGMQLLLIRLRLLSPLPGVSAKALWSCVLLNCMVLAVACSTYFSLCGNGGSALEAAASQGPVRRAVCAKWLAPIQTLQYPSFSAWMLYGEGAEAAAARASSTAGTTGGPGSSNTSSTAAGTKYLYLDFPLDGKGIISVPAGAIISPVFTMWVTLLMLYIVNVLADHAAAGSMAARHIWEVRPFLSEPDLLLLKQLAASTLPGRQHRTAGRQRARSFESNPPWSPPAFQRTFRHILDQTSSLTRRAASLLADAHTPSSFARRTLSTLHLDWALAGQPARISEGMDSARSMPGGWRFGGWRRSFQQEPSSPSSPASSSPGAAALQTPGEGGRRQRWEEEEGQVGWDTGRKGGGAYGGPQPAFLDMVPWYSGTSADLFKTMFDLMVSLKLFLGRFDMRTMQAATAASMADSINDVPAEGDGFTYEQYKDRQEMWFDFIADTGDGGNPTYAVARALAAPALTVPCGPSIPLPHPTHPASKASKGSSSDSSNGVAAPTVSLPRGDVLLLGGDLAYPNPSRETFEQRLFVPFQDALPPPPHYHPGRLVVHKPDLPPAYGVQDPQCLKGLSPRSSRRASATALHRYQGPNAFAIPGNHDWIDGLETFIKQIQHKGWLGGWLLPQEKSYFAVALPQGWWVFGLDLALVGDIDMCQYRYFANVVEQRMAPTDNVIIITHEPIWLLEWYWASSSSSNLRQLVRGHLRGRARVHLAGDLHFYMRHSYCRRGAPAPCSSIPPSLAKQQQGGATGGRSKPQQQQQKGQGPHAAPGGTSKNPSAAAAPGAQQNGAATAAAYVTAGAAANRDLKAAPAAAGGDAAVEQGWQAPSNGSLQQHSKGAGMQRSQKQTHLNEAVAEVGSESSSDLGSDEDEVTGLPVELEQEQQQQLHTPFAGLAAGGRFGSASSSDIPEAPQQPAAAAGGRLRSQHSTPELRQAHLQQQQQQQQGEPGADPGVKESPVCHMRSTLPRLSVLTKLQKEGPGSGPTPLRTRFSQGAATSVTSATSANAPDSSWLGGEDRPGTPGMQLCGSCLSRAAGTASHLCDPEHLICNGSGGAFMHPTHVFSYARFASIKDEAAEATAAIYSNARECTCSQCPGYRVFTPVSTWGHDAASWHQPTSPTGRSDTDEPAGGDFRSGASGGSSSLEQEEEEAPVDGEFRCAAVYPPPTTSLSLGRKNLHLFRFKNDRFDVIGGALYFLSIVSVLPRCDVGTAVLQAPSVREGALAFCRIFLRSLYDIASNSYLSLAMVCLFFLIVFGFAKGGGVGAVNLEQHPNRGPGRRSGGGSKFKLGLKGRGAVIGPLVKLRTGGLSTQLMVAVLHLAAHILLAVSLMLLLELGVEVCIKYESLGSQGMHSLYHWFTAYEDRHFPDPNRLRDKAHTWSLGLYPGVLKYAMALFDLPEAIAVARTAVCQAGGFHALSRLQALGYYAAMLAYYWVLATPAMGFVFGLYLYVAVNWFHVHYDEAFSALRIQNFKAITRMHITPQGDLEIYTLGCDQVPGQWREDQRWYGPDGAGSGSLPSYTAKFPSRWVPDEGAGRSAEGSRAQRRRHQQQQEVSQGYHLVDYLRVPRKRRTPRR